VKAATWIYIDDKDKDKVKELELADGIQPPSSGSHFKVIPTPFDLIIEAGLSRQDLPDSVDVSKPSKIMADVLRQSIGDWTGVKNGKGVNVDFAGPDSIDTLPTYEQNLLASFIYRKVFLEQRKSGKASGPSRGRRSSSGGGGAASGTASRATRSGKKTRKKR